MENVYLFNLESGEYAATMPYDDKNPLPENGTLLEVPTVKKNQVAVFDSENITWTIEKDYRFTHKMIDDKNNILDIENFGDIPAGYKLITLKQAEELEKQKAIEELTMTAQDFINFLNANGLTFEQINAYLEANVEVKLRLLSCNDVFCGVAKALMPISFGEILITADMVEAAFKAKHGIK